MDLEDGDREQNTDVLNLFHMFGVSLLYQIEGASEVKF